MNFWDYLYVLGIPPLMVSLYFFILRKYFGSKIDFGFNKKLEEFKNQLLISTESAKFNFQRKIQDFNLYTVKKHEHYVKLYELILITESRITSIYGFKSIPTYEEYNQKDLREVMVNNNFPDGKINEIFEVWEKKGKEDALDKLKKFMRLVEMQKANNSFWDAKNHYSISKLYLSKAVNKKLHATLGSLGSLLAHYQTLEEMSFEAQQESMDFTKKGNKIRNSIKPQIDELTYELKKELSIGYYQ